MSQQVQYIGYWNNSANQYPEFPLPVPNSGTSEDIQEALSILEKLKTSPKARPLFTKGASPCRLCSTTNGSIEYEVCALNKKKDIVKRIRVPEGYAHYLRDHRVSPDLEALRSLDALL